MSKFGKLKNDISGFFAGKRNRMVMLFGIEGLLFQFVMSLSGVAGFGTNLYATNLGATDSQIGMIQLVANLAAVALLLPIGVLSDRMKNAKTMPVCLMLFMGVAYFFYGSVPMMGQHRMVYFFIFLAMTAGVLVIYNAIWQAFFGDMTAISERNRVYAFRNRFIFAISTIAPIVCGTILTAMPDSDSKLGVLRVFFYVCGACNLLNALVLWSMPGGQRSQEAIANAPKLSVRQLASVLGDLLHSKRFVLYFLSIMFFYFGWHMDWSMWYIGQTQYVGMSEAQLSMFTAICAILQLALLGFFARLNEKKGVNFTFIFCVISLMSCPLTMLVAGTAPVAMRPLVFITMGCIVCIPQCATNLCLVQMLLDVIPARNRSLIVSLNMVFVTLSNAVMPFLGVQLYGLLGGDYRGYLVFNAVVLALRIVAVALFTMRYLRGRKEAQAA